jgi:hypothetical protein
VPRAFILFAIAFATTLFECGSPLSLAVENRDSVGYLLRVVDGQHRAWRVPPNTTGTGPLNDGSGSRFVIISTLDCTEIERLGLATSAHTLSIENGAMANPDLRDGIGPDLSPLEQIVDPCE